MPGLVRNRHLGNQDGVIPKGCEDYLVDLILVPDYPLPQISHAENSFEGLGPTGIIRTEHNIPVGKEADASAVAIMFGTKIVQKFRSTFILTNLDVSSPAGSRGGTR